MKPYPGEAREADKVFDQGERIDARETGSKDYLGDPAEEHHSDQQQNASPFRSATLQPGNRQGGHRESICRGQQGRRGFHRWPIGLGGNLRFAIELSTSEGFFRTIGREVGRLGDAPQILVRPDHVGASLDEL